MSNTGESFDKNSLLQNLKTVSESGISFYLTFTNVLEQNQEIFSKDAESYGIDINCITSFTINLIQYEAIK